MARARSSCPIARCHVHSAGGPARSCNTGMGGQAGRRASTCRASDRPTVVWSQFCRPIPRLPRRRGNRQRWPPPVGAALLPQLQPCAQETSVQKPVSPNPFLLRRTDQGASVAALAAGATVAVLVARASVPNTHAQATQHSRAGNYAGDLPLLLRHTHRARLLHATPQGSRTARSKGA